MADISTDATSWSSTAGSNQPTTSTTIGAGLAPNLQAIQAGVKAALEPLSSVAGTNTITATHATLAAYASGFEATFIPAVTNTGATTLNINSIGAKNVFSGGAALTGGELAASVPVRVQYDGTQFNILGRAKRFVSAAQTITADGTLTLAHGLGSSPTFYMVKLTCTTNDANYTVGQTIIAAYFTLLNTASRNCTIRVDATNLYVRYGAAAATFEAANGSGGGINGLTNASWTATFMAWVL
jgi:hypothetical protein